MGRPPNSGGTAFRFTPIEVAEMEARLQEVNYAIPSREVISFLADKFSASADRSGKFVVQPKQVWNWFQNRRYAQRVKLVKASGSGKLSMPLLIRDNSVPLRNAPIPGPVVPSGMDMSENTEMEFEAKSARDGAWYDVLTFICHRMLAAGDPEVRVRFVGFETEEEEWISVRKCVRQRSLPCEASECVAVLPGDLVLCFQEGKEQALYFDAHVLDAQRRRHDVRGCRCRFLVRYVHDQSEEIVPLRKVCRRPETDYRLQQVHVFKESRPVDFRNMKRDCFSALSSRDLNSATQHQTLKLGKQMESNMDEVVITTSFPLVNELASIETTLSTVSTRTSTRENV